MTKELTFKFHGQEQTAINMLDIANVNVFGNENSLFIGHCVWSQNPKLTRAYEMSLSISAALHPHADVKDMTHRRASFHGLSKLCMARLIYREVKPIIDALTPHEFKTMNDAGYADMPDDVYQRAADVFNRVRQSVQQVFNSAKVKAYSDYIHNADRIDNVIEMMNAMHDTATKLEPTLGVQDDDMVHKNPSGFGDIFMMLLGYWNKDNAPFFGYRETPMEEPGELRHA